MNKILLILLFVLIILNPLASGLTYKIGDSFNLTTSCDNFTCADINTTVWFPNGSIFLSNQQTDNHIYYANILVTPNTQGEYLVYFSDSVNISSTTFSATSSGFELNIQRAIIFIGMFFILIFLFLANAIGIPLLPSRNVVSENGDILGISRLKYVRIILFGTAWFLFIALMFTSSNVALAYLGSTLFGDLFFVIYQIMFKITPLMITLLLLWIIWNAINDRELKSILERGINLGERL
jgi:hypothetical protein|tara:strand:- start:5784 stop:6497 length:714 start_codon:yes stop_codon:yes gene_type:complete